MKRSLNLLALLGRRLRLGVRLSSAAFSSAWRKIVGVERAGRDAGRFVPADLKCDSARFEPGQSGVRQKRQRTAAVQDAVAKSETLFGFAPSSSILRFLIAAIVLSLAPSCFADRIGEVTETSVLDQAIRFFTFRDESVRYALVGAILLGINCGLLGGFIVVRKLALMGDALSHAVLPGVAIGFLWGMTKDPVAIFVGATVAGLLGAFTVSMITQTTRIKEDAALGMVLSGFFAVGWCLISMIGRLETAGKAGIDHFLFGQAAAITAADVKLMGVVTVLSVATIGVFYKEFLVTSFDAAFARSAGFPTKLFHHLLMLLLAFSVVIALQAVGVVLVSAMLITPAAAAYLLTDRMHRLLWLSMLFGVVTGAIGAFFSFLGAGLPTGPLMVLAASLVFASAFLFGPKHGVLVRWWRRRSRSQRIGRENTLKAIYQTMERRDFKGEGATLLELAQRRRETEDDARQQTRELIRHGLATQPGAGGQILLTPEGWQRACEIVRNHRLWELYLTNAAHIAADHVHEDAERIEHVLGEDVVRLLEKRLNYAKLDPHGRPIPSLDDVGRGAGGLFGRDELVGYGKSI